MTQHAGLDPAHWAGFDIDQQILMIANEMNRATRFASRERRDHFRRGYERILRLTDLTIGGPVREALRRELLRWREVAAALYVSDSPDPAEHKAALKVLLQLSPAAARQIGVIL